MRRFLLIFICILGLALSVTTVQEEYLGDNLPPVAQPIPADELG